MAEAQAPAESVSAPGGIADYRRIRRRTVALCEPLALEDYGVQPIVDASPPKWHLAHTSWFFETFLLVPYLSGYRRYHPRFEYLFNSYYNGVGQPFPRPERGSLSRPTVAEVLEYREHVDAAMLRLLDDAGDDEIGRRTELGLHHEQQHQELIVTDLKVTLGRNPLRPGYRPPRPRARAAPAPMRYQAFEGGLARAGRDPGDGFCFDNECPAHNVWLQPFAIGSRLVTNGEYLDFVRDGGYSRPDLWLSAGWSWVSDNGVVAPLYWREEGGAWHEYRLDGEHELAPELPVTHVSLFEADAFARWARARLPTEAEWEHVAREAGASAPAGRFADDGDLHPAGAPDTPLAQLLGDCWEWMSSAYGPYPGFTPLPGTLGEYNGKFMSGQNVLRGGSCATPAGHIRITYRNFFYPRDRWQFTGIRLAKDVT